MRSQKSTYIQMYKQGMSLSDISHTLQVNESTALKHILNYYKECPDQIDISRCITHPEYRDKIIEIFDKAERPIRLKPVKEALPDNCDYNTLYCVLAQYEYEYETR